MSLTDLEVSLEPCDPAALAGAWRRLQARCEAPFFRRWDWLGTWTASLPEGLAPWRLRIARDGDDVALGMFWLRHERRLGIVRSRVLHLHETGLSAFDRVTMEHNGLLAPAGAQTEVLRAACRRLRAEDRIDEIALGAVTAPEFEAWESAARAEGLAVQRRWEKPFFFVDLEAVRAQGGGYLDALSSNTRYQLRRAMKRYAEQGPLSCELARDADEARAWLEELVAMHQSQWNAKGIDGAFGSDFTRRFHGALVGSAAPDGVWMTRVRAGDRVLGYLYNLHSHGVVYNYQAGHVAETDAKLKPGLVCHVLAIEDALRRGCRVYDFMMGGGHFKSSLTNAGGSMVWARLQRPRLLFRIESWLRERAAGRARPAEAATAER